MMLRSNLPKSRGHCRNASSVLDVGGWHNPSNPATHVLDIMPYETRRRDDAPAPEDADRFTNETRQIHDPCDGNWPWPDNFFDFSVCSDTLEDIRDPIVDAKELVRVSRSGYVEAPSRAREIFVEDRMPEIGFPHHRWYCE